MTSRINSIFYALMALLLAILGLGLLIAPKLFIDDLHSGQHLADVSTWPQMVAVGLLLGAALNLFSLFDNNMRPPLHWLLLFFVAGLAACHGLPSGSGWWLWLPALLYLLLLLPGLKSLLPSRPSKAASGELEGTVKWFNSKKGFGFIVAPDEREFFVHFKALQNGGRHSLKKGANVRFQIRPTDRGDQACDVYILD